MEKKPDPRLYKKAKRVDPLKTRIECCTLPSGEPGELHYIPRLNMMVGVNPRNERFPLEVIEKLDGSLSFHRHPTPTAAVATKHGELLFSVAGIRLPADLQEKARTKVIAWQDGKGAGQLLSSLIYRDKVLQQAVQFLPGAVAGVIDPCGVVREGIDTLLDIPGTVTECTEDFVAAVYETVNRTADCIAGAGQSLANCRGGCRRGWRGTWCRGRCNLAYGLDVAWCVANGIVTVLVEAARTVTTCVVRRGRVEGPPQTGDILLFEADSAVGHAIDFATCGYGYSHAALVCGTNVLHALGDGVTEGPLSILEGRDHAIVRLGLSDAQSAALCECVRSQVGEDYDYIEAVTFGTINDPGRELCSMLIMHCLDQIGVSRAELGLAGFVSPNDIARTYDVPHGHLV